MWIAIFGCQNSAILATLPSGSPRMYIGRKIGLFGLGLLVNFLASSAAAVPFEVGDPERGHLRELLFPAKNWEVELLVYTPPGYFSPGDQRRFPVIYWLHGSGGDHLQLESALAALPVAAPAGSPSTAAGKLDALIAAGQIPPLMMVGIGSPTGLWEDNLTELITGELPAFIDANYRSVANRSGRGIEGFSLGSQGLSIYATARPDLYASISLLGGAFLTARWTAAVPALRRDGAEVYLTVGDADSNFNGMVNFSAQLSNQDHQIPNTLDVVPGAVHSHTQLYAARGIELLRWHAARFAKTALIQAGPDLYAQQAPPFSANLLGTLSDPQGLLGPDPTLSWAQVSGPATAQIDSPASLQTVVHLPATGNYFFRLEAIGNITVSDVAHLQLLDLNAGLQLHLPLDGDLSDASGHGHGATAAGGPTAQGGGRFGSALGFDGIDDQISVADFNYGPAFSLSMWVKPGDLAGTSYHYLFSHGGFDAAPSCNLYLPELSATLAAFPPGPEGPLGTSPRVRLSIRDTVGDLTGQGITANTSNLNNGLWHPVVVVVAPGAGNKIYFGGQQVAAGANGGDAYNPATALFFGGRSVSPDGRYFEGSLDEIRLYDRALTSDEIPLLSAYEVTPTAPVVAAGVDRSVYLGSPLLLIGLAADRTPTGQLNVAWSKLSGPGTVQFANSATPETSVVFSQAGTYWLRLTAGDGQLQASDDLQVTVFAEDTPGLLAQWTFDAISLGAFADRSGLFHRATVVPNATVTSPGKIGAGALRLSAADPGYLQVDASPVLDFSPSTESFTVSGWVRLAPGKVGTLLARGSSDQAARPLHFLVADLGADGRSDLQAIVGGVANNSAQNAGPPIDDNNWHHVALVNSAGTNRLFIDGAAVGTATASGSANPGNLDLLIGARRASGNTGSAQILDGDLDDLRIYSRALAPAEVQLLFTGPPIPPCGPPTCLFGDGFELGTTGAWN
jgi:predicted esterase